MESMAHESKRKEPRGRNPLLGLLPVEEVARLKSVKRSAVMKAIHEGRLPAWEHKGWYWVPESSLDKWQPVLGRGRRVAGEKSQKVEPGGVDIDT